MTNYERIQQDKTFCAEMFAYFTGCENVSAWIKWLDREQRELTEEDNA